MVAPGDKDDYFQALPKIELHAHLTGSVSRECLHEIWLDKKTEGRTALEDPLVRLPSEKHNYNLKTFFPLFSSYIYHLITDPADLKYATTSVLENFASDGVVYLELRTTPRETGSMTKQVYIETILTAIATFEASQDSSSEKPTAPMHIRLILSVDRRNTPAEAFQVVALASQFRSQGVVGIDLCGDPSVGGISQFTPVFAAARAVSDPALKITVHFGEAEASGTDEELRTLLSWGPERLGHVIHVSDAVRQEILARGGLGLELCLSCNVHAGMVVGGFEGHHFGEWRDEAAVTIVLCTDDVGVFGSPVSNEYRLVAKHFGLDRRAICRLARGAIEVIFGGEEEKSRLRQLTWREDASSS